MHMFGSSVGAVAVVLVGLGGLGAVDAHASVISLPTTKFTLNNGMTVLLHEDHSVPRVRIAIRFRVGSSRETPGRTGFAHLFEHLMFEGSEHVAEGKFIEAIEAVGGENNAFTTEDETFYYEEVPSNAVDIPLFLESDRMGFYASKIEGALVDRQRDIVKNERRQRVENVPWGNGQELLPSLVFPKGHPYSWSVIVSMQDLSSASIDDVRSFYSTWYAPNNAVMAVVGDFDTATMQKTLENWYSDVPSRGAPAKATAAPATLPGEKRVVIEDPSAPLPRLTIVWPSVELFHKDDANLDLAAEALSANAGSRLQKRLVHDMQVAQQVSVYQHSMERAGTFNIDVIAVPGVPLAQIVAAIDDEIAKLKATGPTDAELAAARAKIETGMADQLDGLDGKASRLIGYEVLLGDPNGFERDLNRYRKADAQAVADTMRRVLGKGRVILSAVPTGMASLAVINPSTTATAGGAR